MTRPANISIRFTSTRRELCRVHSPEEARTLVHKSGGKLYFTNLRGL